MHMNAEIVSVGSELLLGQIVDTHAATMAQVLAECGLTCQRRSTVGDHMERIVATLKEAFSRADIVITIGGLGPTSDDLTRDALAEAMGLPLVLDRDVESHLREIFSVRRIAWLPALGRQAEKPAGAEIIPNANGTAPGLWVEAGGKIGIALPGPKSEFLPMARGEVRDRLGRLSRGAVILSRTLRIAGLGESRVEALLGDILASSNPTVAPYAQPAEVHLRLTASAENKMQAEKLLGPLEADIRHILGNAVYGADDDTLEKAVLDLAIAFGASVSVAESMTGGLVAQRLTSVPGASECFRGGIVSYTAEAKASLLGVSEATLAAYTPVSAEVAQEMATGVRERLGTDWGIAVTGNAGPTSDVGNRPVGLTFIAVAGTGGVSVQEHQLRGSRDDVRQRASQWALLAWRNAMIES